MPDQAEGTVPAEGSSETPPLFDLDPTEPTKPPGDPVESRGAPESGEGLGGLVTRLSDDHPPRWAMNWRPNGKDEDGEIPGEHHPARTAVLSEEPVPSPVPAVAGPAPETPTVAGLDHGASGEVSDGESSAGPGTVGPERIPSVDSIPETIRTDHPSPTAGQGGVLQHAGWMAAVIVAIGWISMAVMVNPDEASSSPVATPVETLGEDIMLARPAPDPERSMMLEELEMLRGEAGSLRSEVTVLRGELEAAVLLKTDHQRLTASLERLERRWLAALDQLSFFEVALEDERRSRVEIANALDRTQRLLDEARGTE